MSLWKKRVEKVESEFHSDKLKNKYIFYDINFRAGDPEEVRAYSSEIMQEFEFYPIVNKLVKFEDSELEGIFSSGRLKPVKGIIKGVKKVKKGAKYPVLWKLFAIIGIALLMLYLYPNFSSNQQILWLAISSMAAAFLVYLFKRVLVIECWAKMVGVYDVESEKSDVRLIIAGDSRDKNKTSFKMLEEDMNNFYTEIAAKYVQAKQKSEKSILVFKKGVSPEQKLASAARNVEQELESLDSRLTKGDISEKTYNEVKQRLLSKKDKVETISDLLSITK